MPSRPRRARLAWPILGGLAITVGVAWIGWTALLAWALAPGRLERWANSRPDRLRIAWTSLHVSPSGAIAVDGLRIAGRTERRLWEIDAEHAAGRFVATPILWRTLRFTDLETRGLVVRARAIDPSATGRRAPRPAALPEISGFPAGPSPPPARVAIPWSYEFEIRAFEELSEVWLDDRRFVGRASGEGSFAIRRRALAEVGDSRIHFEGVRVRAGESDVASGCDGDATFRVVAWRYRGAPLVEVARHFVGRVDLTGELEPREIIESLFGDRPWLELPASGARVEITAALDRGRWQPPSRLRGEISGARVALLDFAARGDARLAADVTSSITGPRLESRIDLGRWTFSRGDDPPLGDGEGLHLAAVASSPALGSEAANGQLEIDLGRVRIPDLGRLEFLWPAGSIDALASEEATLTGRLAVAGATRTGEGEAKIAIRRLAAVVRGESVVGDVDLTLKLADADLAAARFSIGGSSLVLRDFSTLTSKGETVGGWQGSLRVPKGTLGLRRPFSAAGEIEARLDDTRPIVALWDARRDVPGWAQRLLTIDHVVARGDFAIDPGGATLHDLRVPLSTHSFVRATARWGRAARVGRLLLSWRSLAAGIEVSPAGRSLHFQGADAWFESPLPAPAPPPEAHPAAPSPAPPPGVPSSGNSRGVP